jgi:hypothetical protein
MESNQLFSEATRLMLLKFFFVQDNRLPWQLCWKDSLLFNYGGNK